MSKSNTNGLSNVQLELLKVFAIHLPEEELLELRATLSNFFAQRIRKRVGEIWEKKQYNNDLMEKWLEDESQ